MDTRIFLAAMFAVTATAACALDATPDANDNSTVNPPTQDAIRTGAPRDTSGTNDCKAKLRLDDEGQLVAVEYYCQAPAPLQPVPDPKRPPVDPRQNRSNPFSLTSPR